MNNKILDLLMLFSEAGGCSKHFFGVRCSFGHPMEGFQSFFPNFVTHQILLCTPKLKRPYRVLVNLDPKNTKLPIGNNFVFGSSAWVPQPRK